MPAANYVGDPRAAAVAEAAHRLVELRDRWLNLPEWFEWMDEPVPGYPKRPMPHDEAAATALKTRTLTSLYKRPPDMARRRAVNAWRLTWPAASAPVG